MNDIHALRERAKELDCLYRIHEIVSRRRNPPAHAFIAVLETIPDGWMRPERTGARIQYLGRNFVGPGYASGGAAITEPIRMDGVAVGCVEVTLAPGTDDDRPDFLDEERSLLRTIAHRLGEYLEWKHTELLGERAAPTGVHWRWRQNYAEALAAALDPKRFGVRALYVGGSTESADAGPGSDIDLLVVFDGSDEQQSQLAHWLEGWSQCLAELALQQTGYGFPRGILNVQWSREEPDQRHRTDLRKLTIRNPDD